MIESYTGLIVWQRAMELAESVYELSAGFPSSERFGLAAQVRRAAVSVPSNIAEGYERRSRRDYRRFVSIACGSLAELETQLLLCTRVSLATEQAVRPAMELADEVGRMLRAIERSLRGEPTSKGVRESEAIMSCEWVQSERLSPQPSALSPARSPKPSR